MKNNLCSFLIISALVFSSCEGPQGEPGPQGAQGTQGLTGAAGAKGNVGTIPFFASGWIANSEGLEGWIKNYANKTSSVSIEGDVMESIKQADLDKGVFFVYDTWYADKSAVNSLAYDYIFGTDNHVWYSFGVEITDKGPSLGLYATFGKEIDPKKYFSVENEIDHYYRFVFIPASAKGRMQGINFKDYNAVKAALGLKD